MSDKTSKSQRIQHEPLSTTKTLECNSMDGVDTARTEGSTEVLVDAQEELDIEKQEHHKAAGEQELQESKMEAIAPPTVGMKFETFEAAQAYYQNYAMQNGFAVNIEYR